MELEFDKEMMDEFVSEAREHMEKIEEDFLTLEKQKDDPDLDLVNKVFRAIHTIKGCAGFLGLTNINELSHVMETMLSMIRNNEIKPELKFVDPLLEGVDVLNSMIDNVEESNTIDIAVIQGKLTELLSSGPSIEIIKELDSNAQLLDLKGVDIGFDITEFTLKNIPESNFLYTLKYDLIEFTKKGGKNPIALIKKLLAEGDIVDAKIEIEANDLHEGLPEGPLLYDVLFATQTAPDEIAKQLELSPDCINQVNRDNLVVLEEFKEHDKVVTEQIEDKAETKVEEAVPAVRDEVKVAVVDHEKDKAEISKPKPHAGSNPSSGSNTIRINVDILEQLMMLAGELVLVRNQQLINIDKTDPVSRSIVQRLDIVTSELQESIMRTRMQPIGNVLSKFTRVARDLGNKLSKSIEIEITGAEVELDKTILESLADPLTHLVRNCCDHGIEMPESRKANGKPESGLIELKAYHEGGQINIEINDDGKGINVEAITKKVLEKKLKSEAELLAMSEKELMSLILLPGFSTAEQVSDISGRGVGMDVVKSNIEKLGGTIDIDSVEGKGSKMHLRLPLTLAIIPCLIVTVGDYRYAIPQVNLVELMSLYDEEIGTRIERASNNEIFRLRDTLLPMVRLAEVLKRPDPFTEDVKSEITETYRKQIEKSRDFGMKDRVKHEENDSNVQPKLIDEAFNNGVTDVSKGPLSQTLNFTVLKVGSRRFGLIVDKVLGTEEIVVKPMHPALKSLSCYSGATVMGDGKVALILDVDGISKHACVELDGNTKEAFANDDNAKEKETHTVLLFKNGEKEQFAIPLPLIRRIERIKTSRMEQVGEKRFITVDGVSTLVVNLDHVLNVSPCIENKEMYLLLPKHINKPFGILISDLLDIAESSMHLNEETYVEEGLLGSSIINDHLTLFIDIYKIIEKAEPAWFSEKRSQSDSIDKKRQILLLEDTPFFRQLIKGYLVEEGYEVITAEDGETGLLRFNETDFDLVVSDIEMPIMDGFTFLQNVRQGKRNNNVPAIAVTALDSEDDKERAKVCGFNKYETKFNRESFLSIVKSMLN